MFWIAEIGINHHGDFDKAKRMIQKAKECGATAVKFQKYNPIKLLGKNSPYLKDAYQFSWKELTELSSFSKQLSIKFGCSVFDINDVPIVDRISDYHKIASRMNRNQEFISKIEKCKKLTFMSIQPDMGTKVPERFKLMWCITQYPTLKEDILKYPYNKDFGLSSHCPDISVIEYAIEKGAKVIEVHVCEDKNEVGCDISSSITFDNLKRLISMGNGNVPMSEMSLSQGSNKNS